MKKFIVWELWNINGQYLGFYPEHEYALAVSYANSFGGSVTVIKNCRYTEL